MAEPDPGHNAGGSVNDPRHGHAEHDAAHSPLHDVAGSPVLLVDALRRAGWQPDPSASSAQRQVFTPPDTITGAPPELHVPLDRGSPQYGPDLYALIQTVNTHGTARGILDDAAAVTLEQAYDLVEVYDPELEHHEVATNAAQNPNLIARAWDGSPLPAEDALDKLPTSTAEAQAMGAWAITAAIPRAQRAGDHEALQIRHLFRTRDGIPDAAAAEPEEITVLFDRLAAAHKSIDAAVSLPLNVDGPAGVRDILQLTFDTRTVLHREIKRHVADLNALAPEDPGPVGEARRTAIEAYSTHRHALVDAHVDRVWARACHAALTFGEALREMDSERAAGSEEHVPAAEAQAGATTVLSPEVHLSPEVQDLINRYQAVGLPTRTDRSGPRQGATSAGGGDPWAETRPPNTLPARGEQGGSRG